jgi:integral membrane protein
VQRAFERYRLMSFITGTTLLILCVFLALHTFDLTLWKHLKVVVTVVGIGHGVILYPIYMVMCFQFWMKSHIRIGVLILMLFAGFVPGLAFYMEHRVRTQLFSTESTIA